MAYVFKAPIETPALYNRKSIFLAGSIDMGKADNWQARIEKALEHLPVVIFNPRRDDWDNSWVQDITNDQFREQVNWELNHLDRADVIAVYFDPQGKAPITLMELGLHAASGKCVVCCPEGYWRRGNVQIVCDRFGIPLHDDIEDFVAELLKRLEAS